MSDSCSSRLRTANHSPINNKMRFAGDCEANTVCRSFSLRYFANGSACGFRRKVMRKQWANAICRRTNCPNSASSGKVVLPHAVAIGKQSSTAPTGVGPQRNVNNRRYCENLKDCNRHAENAEWRRGEFDSQHRIPRKHDNNGDGEQEVQQQS